MQTCDRGHETIRLPTQPCPHPDCWRGGTELTEAVLRPWPGRPTDRKSRLAKLRVGDKGYWAWVVPEILR